MPQSIAGKLKDAVTHFGESSAFGDMMYNRIKYTMANVLGTVMSEEQYAKWFYHLYTGKQLNLEDPKYYDEKLWWLKLNNRDPLMTICSDKHKARDYVKECGFEDTLIEQVDVFESADQLDFSKYDFEVVAKCNHNSGSQIFYDPSNPMDSKTLRMKIKQLDYIMHKSQYPLSREWNYKDIPRRIVVEKVIRDKDGKLPLDYKFMCFDGEPKLLTLDIEVMNQDGSYNHEYPRNIYDMNFNLLPVYETRPNADYPIEKPENFEYMVEVARKLSEPFPHCRVDLYNMDGKVYFGEITFYHGGGCNNLKPESFDLEAGSWIDIDNPKIVRKA